MAEKNTLHVKKYADPSIQSVKATTQVAENVTADDMEVAKLCGLHLHTLPRSLQRYPWQVFVVGPQLSPAQNSQVVRQLRPGALPRLQTGKGTVASGNIHQESTAHAGATNFLQHAPFSYCGDKRTLQGPVRLATPARTWMPASS